MASRRLKPLEFSAFEFVFDRDWKPVKLGEGTIPESLKTIPREKVYGVYASGQAPDYPFAFTVADLEAVQITLGGIDVFRYAEPQDGVRFNKDHYEVIVDPSDPRQLAILGPLKG